MQNQNVRIVSSFIIGLIIGIGIHWLWVHNKVSSVAQNDATFSDSSLGDTTTDASSTSPTISGNNGLIVNDQVPGNQVAVQQVVLKNIGWVVIHDDVNGKPGRILGAYLFDHGTTNNGHVDLLRNTAEGHSYFAVLHSNVGDYHHFNSQTDKMLIGSDGSPIMVKFTTTATGASMSPASNSSSLDTTSGSSAAVDASSTIPLGQ